jgi:predicted MFS family arabinose efflux permease
MMYSLAANAMIQNIGLAWTFRTLGIISFVVNFICSILLKDRNKHVSASLNAFDVKLLKRPEFWLLLGYGFFSVRGIFFTETHD